MTAGAILHPPTGLMICAVAMVGLSASSATAGVIEVFHADSLGGPLAAVKKEFEARHRDVTLSLTSGTSRQLADRILNGDTCDVFASSSPAVTDDLMTKKIAGSGQGGALWYVVFSANEMVVIVEKGNPHKIEKIADLAKPDVKFTRITGEKDLGTGRTIEFLKRAAALEAKPDLAEKIVAASIVDPAKPNSVPDTVRSVREGKANAGVVYYSAAVAAQKEVDIIRFPASVNLSEAIRNAAAVPGTAKNPQQGIDLVRFLLSADGQRILQETGQPPIVPPIVKGTAPAGVHN